MLPHCVTFLERTVCLEIIDVMIQHPNISNEVINNKNLQDYFAIILKSSGHA